MTTDAATTTDLLALLDSDPAAGLRATAELMRQAAQVIASGGDYRLGGSDGEWEIHFSRSGSYRSEFTPVRYEPNVYPEDGDGAQYRNAQRIIGHIAAIGSPAVALAIAACLDSIAASAEHHIPEWAASTHLPAPLEEIIRGHYGEALDVARAYLTGATA